MNPIQLKDLFQIIPHDQRLVIVYNGVPVLEKTFEYDTKFVVDVRALQFPEGDVGLGITLSDTVIYMPVITGLFGRDE